MLFSVKTCFASRQPREKKCFWEAFSALDRTRTHAHAHQYLISFLHIS